jgi:hypothetical protein
MSVDARVLDVIELLYEAAMDESRWPDTLKQLAALTESQAATFWVLDRSDQPRYPTFTFVNLDPTFIQEYLDYMAPLDPTAQYVARHPQQSIIHDGLVITERDKGRNAYYDWHLRYGDLRFRMVGQASPAPAVQAGVSTGIPARSCCSTIGSGSCTRTDVRTHFTPRATASACPVGYGSPANRTTRSCRRSLPGRSLTVPPPTREARCKQPVRRVGVRMPSSSSRCQHGIQDS